jgi:hypothetical protein
MIYLSDTNLIWENRKMNTVLSMITAILALPALGNAADFSVSKEQWNGKQTNYVICDVGQKDRLSMYQEMGVPYGDAPYGIFLKNFEPGTKVSIDGTPVAEAVDNLAKNGYQQFYMPQDEYEMTIQKPDGSSLTFELLKYDGYHICALSWGELKKALSK